MTSERSALIERLQSFEKKYPEGAWIPGLETTQFFNPDGPEAARVIGELERECSRLHARLEDDRFWTVSPEGEEVCIAAEPGSVPDGIECRDETIRLQEERIDGLERVLADYASMLRAVGVSQRILDSIRDSAIRIED